MIERLYLGLDVGHTVIKAAAYDERGRVAGDAALPTITVSPAPDRYERDMEHLWRVCAAVIRDCLASLRTTGIRVAGVGVTGHGDGIHLVDEAGRPVRPAILATDSRAAEDAARLAAEPTGSRALRLTGQVPAAYSQAALLNWLRRSEPESLYRARWALYAKDWIRYRLTGGIATDPSDASAAFIDAPTHSYSTEALDLFGLRDLVHLLPPIRLGSDVAGYVTPAAAAETGLPPDTPVVAGAHDVHACAIGMGAVRPGDGIVIMGTFSINAVVDDTPRGDPRWQARSFPQRDRWLHMSTSPTGMSNLDWLVERQGPCPPSGGPDVAAALDAVFALPAERRLPLFLPFLYGSPLTGRAGGALLDLHGWHTRDDMLAAAVRGITFTHRWHIDALAERFTIRTPIRVGGGGTRNREWTQLMADVLGRAVEIVDSPQAGCSGAALLAAVGTGAAESVDTAAAAWARVLRRHEPRDERAAALSREYHRWLAAATANRPMAASPCPDRDHVLRS